MATNGYDVVISNGRVIDLETRYDDIANVGISDGVVKEISKAKLTGKQVLDVKGLIVAPGFIDMHAHGHDAENYKLQAHDGVTSSLELEVGTVDVPNWYKARETNTPINFGVSIGHIPVGLRTTLSS